MAEPNVYSVGEIYERGAWIPTQLHAPNAAKQIARHFGEVEKKRRIVFDKLKAEVLKGDDPRTPKPKQQPFFVTVYAKVKAKNDEEQVDVSWVNDLRLSDLERLRTATKKVASAHNIATTPADLDLIIGFLGPKVARKMLEEKLSDQVVDGHVLKAAERRKIWQA